MSHITYNKVIPNFIVGDYGAKVDNANRVRYYTLKICTTGANKNKPVWSTVIERLVPQAVKDQVQEEIYLNW
jgi:hypothetical protein